MWLRGRIELASRATDVLEEKTHALVQERRRLRQHVDETHGSWERAMKEADGWLLRAVAIGGRQQIALAGARVTPAAEASIIWRSLMGVTYPARVSVRIPDTAAAGATAETSALAFAAEACGKALQQALDHAAATRALERLERELSMTRRRLRGLRDEWIPRLEDTLRRVELYLGEEEREDMVRSKWAAGEHDRERT